MWTQIPFAQHVFFLIFFFYFMQIPFLFAPKSDTFYCFVNPNHKKKINWQQFSSQASYSLIFFFSQNQTNLIVYWKRKVLHKSSCKGLNNYQKMIFQSWMADVASQLILQSEHKVGSFCNIWTQFDDTIFHGGSVGSCISELLLRIEDEDTYNQMPNVLFLELVNVSL